jgi:type II secretory pathway component PulM
MTMAKANDTQSLFEGLASIRTSLEQARAQLEGLHDGMSEVDTGERAAGDPEPHTEGWNPARDLREQIGEALERLDEALAVLSPEGYHIDQQVARRAQSAEVANG